MSAPYGLSNKVPLEIGVEELNKAGGILGRPVQLVVEDWKREVPLAVAAYKKLVMSDKCLVVFTEGTEGTTACMQEALQLYSEFPHLQFAFWTAHDGVTVPFVPNMTNTNSFSESTPKREIPMIPSWSLGLYGQELWGPRSWLW